MKPSADEVRAARARRKAARKAAKAKGAKRRVPNSWTSTASSDPTQKARRKRIRRDRPPVDAECVVASAARVGLRADAASVGLVLRLCRVAGGDNNDSRGARVCGSGAASLGRPSGDPAQDAYAWQRCRGAGPGVAAGNGDEEAHYWVNTVTGATSHSTPVCVSRHQLWRPIAQIAAHPRVAACLLPFPSPATVAVLCAFLRHQDLPRDHARRWIYRQATWLRNARAAARGARRAFFYVLLNKPRGVRCERGPCELPPSQAEPFAPPAAPATVVAATLSVAPAGAVPADAACRPLNPGGAGRTIYEALPAGVPFVAHAGRLDGESEGLLLLTDDNALATGLMHHHAPGEGAEGGRPVRKRYRVEVSGLRWTDADAAWASSLPWAAGTGAENDGPLHELPLSATPCDDARLKAFGPAAAQPGAQLKLAALRSPLGYFRGLRSVRAGARAGGRCGRAGVRAWRAIDRSRGRRNVPRVARPPARPPARPRRRPRRHA